MYKSYSDETTILSTDNYQEDKISIGDYVGYFCPKCFSYNIKRFTKSYEYSYDDEFDFKISYDLMCPECKHKWEQSWLLDPNITPTIALLNKKGYYTDFCCEGHYNDHSNFSNGDNYLVSKPYILFSADYSDLCFQFTRLPYPWYVASNNAFNNMQSYKHYRTTIRANIDGVFDSSKQYALDMIYEWAESLPDLNITNKEYLERIKSQIEDRRNIEHVLYNNIIIL